MLLGRLFAVQLDAGEADLLRYFGNAIGASFTNTPIASTSTAQRRDYCCGCRHIDTARTGRKDETQSISARSHA